MADLYKDPTRLERTGWKGFKILKMCQLSFDSPLVNYKMTLDSGAPPTQRLWQRTPLVRSSALSDRTGCEVYLKIETFQTSGSFKCRGVSHFANKAVKRYFLMNGLGALDTRTLAIEATKEDPDSWSIPIPTSHVPKEKLPHLVIASGGNAGLAAASAAGILGVPCTVFVPDEQANIVHLFSRYGSNVEVKVGGKDYMAAAKAARAFVDELGDRGISVPPFDDPLVWQGNSTLCTEVAEQLPQGLKPDAIFCSVGGGGLIAGTIMGCENVAGWNDVPIFGIETLGAACFYHSLQINRQDPNKLALPLPEGATSSLVEAVDPAWALTGDTHAIVKIDRLSVVHLAGITSRASSLGVATPSLGAMTMALKRKGPIHCIAISDEKAMAAALQFTNDHFVVPELACSATLVPAYTPHLLDHVLGLHPPQVNGTAAGQRKKVLVFIVCGGSKGSLSAMRMFEDTLSQSQWEEDSVWVDAVRLTPPSVF